MMSINIFHSLHVVRHFQILEEELLIAFAYESHQVGRILFLLLFQQLHHKEVYVSFQN